MPKLLVYDEDLRDEIKYYKLFTSCEFRNNIKLRIHKYSQVELYKILSFNLPIACYCFHHGKFLSRQIQKSIVVNCAYKLRIGNITYYAIPTTKKNIYYVVHQQNTSLI